MGSPGTRTCRDWQWGLAVAALYFGFALISLRWVQSPFGIAYIWPSSGIAVAGLLVLGRACRRPIVALVALASIAANLAGGASPVAALIFSLANVAEALVVVGLSRFDRPDYGRFESPAWVLRFAGAAVAGGLLSGAIALLGAGASDPLDFAISWITTVVLGILIVTPAAATFLRWLRGERSTSARVSPLTRYALLAVTLGASMLTFGQTDYPLLFVPLAMVILTTWLLGVEGAVVSVFVISSCAILATGMGIGPITFVESDHGEIVFLQFYLLVLQISALPLAAMLSETRRKEASLTEGKRLLETAEKIAHVGHWRYDLAGETVAWSAEVYRIHGYDPSRLISLDLAILAYLPGDRERVRAQIARSIELGESFSFDARILRGDGSVRHVHAKGDVEMCEGKVVALFGVVLDVTEKALALEELQAAREEAEARAAEAEHLADTDQLTGVPNRRKAMAVLDHEIARLHREDAPLSIILLDVDYFKAINDTHGHATGDTVLRAIAQAGVECLRRSDVFGRIGGEEFLAVLPGTAEQLAATIAERLRAKVAALDIPDLHRDGVSISLGVAQFRPGADATWLLQAADNALYAAKSQGRNRLVLAA